VVKFLLQIRCLVKSHVFTANLLPAWLLTIPCPAAPVDFILVAPGDDANVIEIGLVLNESLVLSDSDTSDVSGTISADLDLAVVGQDALVAGWTITGGAIGFSDVEFSLGFGLLTINGSQLGGTPTTVVAPSIVNDGLFDATDHELSINQGTFLVSGLIEDNFDLATLPFNGPGTGNGTISMTEASRSGVHVIYDVSLQLPIGFNDRVLEQPTDPVTMDVAVAGMLVGMGQVTAVVPVNPGDSVWAGPGSGDWQMAAQWSPATVPNGNAVVFADTIEADSFVELASSVLVDGIRFDSPWSYQLQEATGAEAMVTVQGQEVAVAMDVLQGTHRLLVDVVMDSDLIIHVESDSLLEITGSLQLNGHTLTKSGPGDLVLDVVSDTGLGFVEVLDGSLSAIAISGDFQNIGGVVAPGMPGASVNPLVAGSLWQPSTGQIVAIGTPEPSGMILALALTASCLPAMRCDLRPGERRR